MPATIAAMPRSIERPVEPHLGDVIGSIAPMQPIRVTHKHPRWIEDGTNLIIAVVATAVFAPLCVLGPWIAFAFAGKPPLQ